MRFSPACSLISILHMRSARERQIIRVQRSFSKRRKNKRKTNLFRKPCSVICFHFRGSQITFLPFYPSSHASKKTPYLAKDSNQWWGRRTLWFNQFCSHCFQLPRSLFVSPSLSYPYTCLYIYIYIYTHTLEELPRVAQEKIKTSHMRVL